MHNFQEKIQLKVGHLRNVTIAGQNFNILPVSERVGKALEGMFKTYKDSPSEGEDLVGEPMFNDIAKMLTICDESKSGLSTYYIKFWHGKTVFDEMLDRIGELKLKNISPTNIIFSRKMPK